MTGSGEFGACPRQATESIASINVSLVRIWLQLANVKGSVNEVVMYSSGLLDISYAPHNQMASTIMNLTFSLTDPFTNPSSIHRGHNLQKPDVAANPERKDIRSEEHTSEVQ